MKETTEENKRPNYWNQRTEPPYFGKPATFAFFLEQQGIDYVDPFPYSIRQYDSYRCWCYANGYDALYGGAKTIEDGYEAYLQYWERKKAEIEFFWHNVIDTDDET